jgi:hypothetical protein
MDYCLRRSNRIARGTDDRGSTVGFRRGGVQVSTRCAILRDRARRKGKWLLERHTQSWVVTPVTPIERDSTGRVIGYVQGYPDGTVFRAGRLP